MRYLPALLLAVVAFGLGFTAGLLAESSARVNVTRHSTGQERRPSGFRQTVDYGPKEAIAAYPTLRGKTVGLTGEDNSGDGSVVLEEFIKMGARTPLDKTEEPDIKISAFDNCMEYELSVKWRSMKFSCPRGFIANTDDQNRKFATKTAQSIWIASR